VQLVLSAAAQREARPLVQPVLALLIDGTRSNAFPLVKPQMLQLVDGPRTRGSRLVLRLLDVLRAAAAQTNDRNGGHLTEIIHGEMYSAARSELPVFHLLFQHYLAFGIKTDRISTFRSLCGYTVRSLLGYETVHQSEFLQRYSEDVLNSSSWLF
jgi:hypothetical protein